MDFTTYLCREAAFQRDHYRREILADGLERAASTIERLTAEVERLTREKDAAVWDIREAALVRLVCVACKHVDVLPGGEPCKSCQKGSCFEWRGLCAENGGTEVKVDD